MRLLGTGQSLSCFNGEFENLTGPRTRLESLLDNSRYFRRGSTSSGRMMVLAVFRSSPSVRSILFQRKARHANPKTLGLQVKASKKRCFF
jgi:hypothetical protein